MATQFCYESYLLSMFGSIMKCLNILLSSQYSSVLGMFDTEYLNILLLWQHTDSYLLVIPASRNETAEYLAIKLCYLAYLPGMFGSINEATTLLCYQGQK